MSSAGSIRPARRWGVDADGNGKLTAWKAISAEEVTAEIVAAVANRDSDRFARVLLTADELSSRSGLGKAKSEAVAAKIAKAAADFRTLADRQKTITPESKWLQFSGSRPGVVPAGTDDSTRDIEVYENVVAIVETGEKHTQVQIGTLVRVGNTWKTIDVRRSISGEGQPEVAARGLLLPGAPAGSTPGLSAGPNDESQKLIAEMEGMEAGDPRRVEIIQKLVDQAKTAEERSTWSRQLADTLSAGVQSGKLPDGEKRLQALLGKCPTGIRTKPGGLRQVPPADGRLRPGDFRAQGRRGQDAGRLFEGPRTVHLRLSREPRRGRGHAPVGHCAGVCRAGRRREEVVRADRPRVRRFAAGQEGGRGGPPHRFRRHAS